MATLSNTLAQSAIAQPVRTQSINSQPATQPLAAPITQAPAIGSFSTNAQSLSFIPQRSERDRVVKFRSQGSLGTVGFASNGVIFALPVAFPEPSSTTDSEQRGKQRRIPVQRIRMQFVGSTPGTKITGVDPLPGVVNEQFGTQPEDIRNNVTTFASIKYLSLYQGVDLRYDGTDGQLKSTFLLQPQADPKQISWRYQGIDSTQIDPRTGDLILQIQVRLPPALQTELGLSTGTTTITMTEHAPSAWQETPNGRVAVPVQFRLGVGNRIGFALGAYDTSLPLTIDPVIGYSSAYGGSLNERVNDLVSLPNGSIALVGWTLSTDFGALQDTTTPTIGVARVLVTRRAPDGTVQWTSYFGGNSESRGQAIATLADGTLIITGFTNSSDYPLRPTTPPNAPPACTSGSQSAILATINATNGTLMTSRCLGSNTGSAPGGTGGYGIAVASDGTVWVTGSSRTGDFLQSLQPPIPPATTPPAPVVYGVTTTAQITATPTRSVGFLVRLSGNLNTAQTRIYFGSNATTNVTDLSLDAQNRPVVVGGTTYDANTANSNTTRFPVTGSPFQATAASNALQYMDAFVTEFLADGSGLFYSTLMGGTSADLANSVTIGHDTNDTGQIYITGETTPIGVAPYPRSFATPLQMDAIAWHKDWAGFSDAFVVRFNPLISGANALVYGSLLASAGYDYGYGIAARQGVAYITGKTDGALSLSTPIQPKNPTSEDIFVAAIDTTTATPTMPMSTFLGSSGSDEARGIAVDSAGQVYVGGTTTIVDTSSQNGTTQAFAAQILPAQPSLTLAITDANGQPVQGLTLSNGWPVLNASGSGVIANPVKVTAQIVNQTGSTLQNSKFKLEAIGNAPGVASGRFYPKSIDGSCQVAASQTNNSANGYSLNYQRSECIRTFAPNTQWQYEFFYWIQPSFATTIQFSAHWETSTGASIAAGAANVAVPLASIRTVIVVPGFMGAWPDYLSADKMVIDPIAKFYDGLLIELQVLGYEPGITLMPFPYRWYGGTGTSQDKNDVPQHALALATKIDTWWDGKLRPAYAQTNRFDLIAHSTGGLITRQYVANTGSANKLQTVVLVAIPHRGAPMAFGAWEGQILPIAKDNSARDLHVLRQLWMALAQKAGCYTTQQLNLIQSIPLVDADQLYQYVQGKPCETRYRNKDGETTILSTHTSIGIPLTRDLFPAKEAQLAGRTYLERSGTLENDGYLNNLLDNTSGIGSTSAINAFAQQIVDDGNLFTVFSTNKGTLQKFLVSTDPVVAPLWRNGTAVPVGWASIMDTKLADNLRGMVFATDTDPLWAGDGTVPLWSGNLQQLVTDPVAAGKVKVLTYAESQPITHNDFFNTELTMRQLAAAFIYPNQPQAVLAVRGGALPYVKPPNDWLNQVGQVNAVGGTILFLAARCPVTVLVTDPQGRRVGTTPQGQVVNEIPGSYYSGYSPNDEPAFISFPQPPMGTYTFTFTGMKAGEYSIDTQIISSTLTTRLGSFSGSIQPGQVVSFTASYNGRSTPNRMLLVDDRAGSAVISHYQTALTALNRTPVVWDVAVSGLPKPSDLYPYDSVIWATGAAQTFSDSAALTLNWYTNQGGKVLVSGQDIEAGIQGTPNLASALSLAIRAASVDSRTIQGTDILSGLTFQLNGGDGANNQVTPSSFTPVGSAKVLATYSGGTGNTHVAGERYETFEGRFITLGFGFEAISTAAQRTAVLTRLLSWLENGGTPQASTAFPATPILDMFNRADGPVGANWTGATSTFAIQSNTLQTTLSSGSTDRMVWGTSFGPDQEVSTTLSAVTATATEIDLILKEADRGDGEDLLEVWYQPQRGTVQVWTVHNWGTWIQHGVDIPVSFQAGDQFGARAKADGTVEVYKNGTLVGSVTVASTWPSVASGGRVGVWLVDAFTTAYDDFGGGTLP